MSPVTGLRLAALQRCLLSAPPTCQPLPAPWGLALCSSGVCWGFWWDSLDKLDLGACTAARGCGTSSPIARSLLVRYLKGFQQGRPPGSSPTSFSLCLKLPWKPGACRTLSLGHSSPLLVRLCFLQLFLRALRAGGTVCTGACEITFLQTHFCPPSTRGVQAPVGTLCPFSSICEGLGAGSQSWGEGWGLG